MIVKVGSERSVGTDVGTSTLAMTMGTAYISNVHTTVNGTGSHFYPLIVIV